MARQLLRLVSTLLLPVALILVLTACGLSGGTPSSDFQAGAGTLNFSNGPGLSVMLTYNLREVPDDNEIDIVITGPAGWNDDQPITSTARFVSTGRKWSWRNIFRGSDGQYLTVESGTYTVEAHFNGRTYSRQLTVDSSNRLATAANLDVGASETEVTINWDPVPSAQSYQVELYSVDDSMPRGTYATIVTSSSHTFSDVALQVDGDYYVAVQAMSADFTAPSPEVPEGQFNMSFAASSFTFTSGSLQRQSMAVQDAGSMARPADPGEGADELPVLNDAETARLVSMARQSTEGAIAEGAASGSGSRLRWDSSVGMADDEIALLAVALEDYPAIAQFAFVDGSLASATLIHVQGDGTLPVCHTPPGNPDARHTILVDLPALRAHYMHGDAFGYCEDEAESASPGIDLAIVDLTDGTTTLDHYSPAGDTIVAIGPWAGSSTLEELFTPVPVPPEPEWIANAVADINYTGPVPGTQAFWTTGIEEEIDDGGGGSDGHSGDDDPEDDPVGDPGTGNDGTGENDGEEEASTCDWGHLEILQLRVEFAQTNYVEDGIGEREKAELALTRARRNGFFAVGGATATGALAGPFVALGSAFVASVIAARVEQDAIDDLAAARQEEARLEGIRNSALEERIKYYNERKCSEIAPDQAFSAEGWLLTIVRPEVLFTRRPTVGVYGQWMPTSS
jgi:hypothetical protein